MKDRVFWRIFRSVFLSFFALWLLLVGVLTFQNLDAKQDQVEHAMGSYEESTLKNCQLVLEGTAEEWEKPAILTNRMTSRGPWGGSASTSRRGLSWPAPP